MRYTIIKSEIMKNYKMDPKSTELVKLQHNTGKSVMVLPFTTNFRKKKSNKDYIQNFNVVIGELSRMLSNKKISKGLDRDILIKELTEKVQFERVEDKSVFVDILNNVFFDNKGELQIFHPLVFNYIFTEKNYVHKKIAQFLFSILCDEETMELIQVRYNTKPKNVFYKLLLDVMPDTNEGTSKIEKEKYIAYLPIITKLFNHDLKIMLSETKFFVENFEKLIKYYYFFYVSQLAIKLNKMFDADLQNTEEVFFSLESEAISRSRTSFNKGWEIVKSNLKTLFSHVNCLEMLNHRNIECDGPYTYIDIKNKIEELNSVETEQLFLDLDEIVQLYKVCIGDIEWGNMGKIEEKYTSKVLNKVYELFRVINYQFLNSQRIDMQKGYYDWFEEFAKVNFLKTRGQLGYTLNLTEEYLIFITRLCIPRGEKMRLNLLFKEYERRGLYFDKDSKCKITEIFEKLNILEKKSDSGDAQYVKSIL